MRTPAHPSSPAVPRMNPHTMIMSLRLSRWKHMVTTSFSAAPLQMGRDCARQKARLHWEQEGEDAAARLEWERGCWKSGEEEEEEGGVSWSEGGDGGSARCEPVVRTPAGGEVVDLISMMVLLVKQVHLQKVGAAGG